MHARQPPVILATRFLPAISRRSPTKTRVSCLYASAKAVFLGEDFAPEALARCGASRRSQSVLTHQAAAALSEAIDGTRGFGLCCRARYRSHASHGYNGYGPKQSGASSDQRAMSDRLDAFAQRPEEVAPSRIQRRLSGQVDLRDYRFQDRRQTLRSSNRRFPRHSRCTHHRALSDSPIAPRGDDDRSETGPSVQRGHRAAMPIRLQDFRRTRSQSPVNRWPTFNPSLTCPPGLKTFPVQVSNELDESSSKSPALVRLKHC